MSSLLFLLIAFALLGLTGAFAPRILRPVFARIKQTPHGWPVHLLRYGSWSLMVFWFLSLSFVDVGGNEVGLLTRVWGTALPEGQIIARDTNNRGPQAWILGPGIQFIPFVHVFYDVTTEPQVVVPQGEYAQLVARDGAPMPQGAYLAPAFPKGQETAFLDATMFLTQNGIKGPQLSVLTPGTYRINTYLWAVQIIDPKDGNPGTSATIIPGGSVGVVKSNVADSSVNCTKTETKVVGTIQYDALSAVLVPRGCIGIWSEVLPPGAYYLNRAAYDVTVVNTRVQTWPYAGGYTSRRIDLSVGQDGKVDQIETSVNIERPENAADNAINVKVGSWVVYQDLRLVIQVSPDNAPIVVGAVGGLKQVEDSIITPAVQSIVRDVLGGSLLFPNETDATGKPVFRQVEILDLIRNRDVLQAEIEKRIRAAGEKAGLSVREVRLANPDIPPEMLLGTKRQQLAEQLKQAFTQEQAAQSLRIQVEQTKATADQQPALVHAQIDVQVSQLKVTQRTNEGNAERSYLEQVAAGQKAQAEVLGPEKVLMLNLWEKTLDALGQHPDILGQIKLPSTMVLGQGSLEGVAAILKNSGLNVPTDQKPTP